MLAAPKNDVLHQLTVTREDERPHLLGGGAHVERKFSWAELAPYMAFDDPGNPMPTDAHYDLVGYAPMRTLKDVQAARPASFALAVPVTALVPHLNYTELKTISLIHGMRVPRGMSRDNVEALLRDHRCLGCEPHSAVFAPGDLAAPREPAAHPRQEYLDDAAKSVKIFSLDELDMFAPIPEAHRAVYALGARLKTLEPALDIPVRTDTVVDADGIVCYAVPWMRIANKASKPAVHNIVKLHGFKPLVRTPKAETLETFGKHACSDTCPPFKATFEPVHADRKPPPPSRSHPVQEVVVEPPEDTNVQPYPPPPLSDLDKINIIREFCEDLRPSCFEESGCAVCGQLTRITDLKPMHTLGCSFDALLEPGVARRERMSSEEPVTYDNGPVLDRRPVNALANGLWIGDVPTELSCLTYAEQCLVARARTNRCVVRVGTLGYSHSKMTCNAISFALPTLKVYHTLPPPQAEMNEVLAFLFTGINPPTEDDLERTPMLVRRNAVGRALEWLKLNHSDYTDLQIDSVSLNSYPVCGPIVRWVHRPDASEGIPNVAATSMHEPDSIGEDTEQDDGGKCPFKVNGLIGTHMETMSFAARKAAAVHHLRTGGSALAVGQGDTPESKYDNPQLYPQLFPWLFPYGAGGLGNNRLAGLVSESTQKRWLLMHHDKRFQTEVAVRDSCIQRRANKTGAHR
ncbi:hypothetical protein DFP72DRAFT_812213 [Ephemerocybe angulata]|uniref:DUF6570 domain-containing protein n=1 Tax=Ephemerocybe angulata TaxID=980116 RepID=A0A8H6M7I1_9AGAR|nr:hypothetical protein DFP72DRAFT_812213 [Tulosesus angulatus]